MQRVLSHLAQPTGPAEHTSPWLSNNWPSLSLSFKLSHPQTPACLAKVYAYCQMQSRVAHMLTGPGSDSLHDPSADIQVQHSRCRCLTIHVCDRSVTAMRPLCDRSVTAL
jgi:hypothetical protein